MTGDELLLKVEIEQFRKRNEHLSEENECLEAMKAGVEIRIADLNAEIERLRELLRDVEPCLSDWPFQSELRDRIKKEVGDE